jgi:HPt (histidine-containing phosphotransfer) domain-containing protein
VDQKVALRQPEQLGYTADVVANGFKAIKAFERTRSDVDLADIDGYMNRPVKTESVRAASERSGHAASSRPAEHAPGRQEVKSGLNQSMLARLRELSRPGEPNILCELIDIFLAETPRQIDALRQAIKEGNAAVLWRVAHTLKGSSGNLGADHLSAACSELEKLAKTGAVDDADKLLAAVETELREAERHLTAEKGK